AGRALQLSRELFDRDLEEEFLQRLEAAKSNIPENKNGRVIYEKFVKPAMLDWAKAIAHYAISSLFQDYKTDSRIFSFRVHDEDRETLTSGKTKLLLGRTRVTSEITQESDVLSYAILYMGEHNLTGSVRKFDSAEAYEAMAREVKAVYESANFPETIRVMDRHFGGAAYSLSSLFKDEQRRILNEILASTREDLESRFRLIIERYEPLMKFLDATGVPMPPALRSAADVVLQGDLWNAIHSENLDFDLLRALLDEGLMRERRVLDYPIRHAFVTRTETLLEQFAEHPEDLELARSAKRLAETAKPLALGLEMWRAQNLYWDLLQHRAPEMRGRAEHGDPQAAEWISEFAALGDQLGFAARHLNTPQAVQMAA
ncbi:MAG TPA: DUF3536 domain-containing protein, partial [Verrucomicrobiae bacterium]|nr:DUF3536 domain-containing protein [Verrucomicrobiae bacterium]